MQDLVVPQKVVVLGAAGQLGSELCRQLGTRAVPVTRRDLDLRALSSISEAIGRLRPDAVINAAAYTQVDRAEREPQLCRTINALAVREIAKAGYRADCPLVQLSTDYVFGENESRTTPYSEDDAPGPINVYGQTKLEGEHYAAAHPRHFIMRTCGLYTLPRAGSPHQNFVTTMLRLAAERTSIRVVHDQHCTPSYVPHVTRAILFLLSTEAYGTYHVVQEGAATWYDFAVELFQTLSLAVDVRPISSAQYSTPARRPAFSLLDGAKYGQLAGSPLPHWRTALRECLAAEPSQRHCHVASHMLQDSSAIYP